MSFFSEERASELREIFFESAQELLQALNEEGLELEKRPADTEIIRTIRRTVHTLKGDSAACGFRELSELAHELEDVLTPEIAARSDSFVVQVILSAADMFEAMLAAYRGKLQPPDGTPLRRTIHEMAQNPAPPVVAQGYEPTASAPDSAVAFEPKFQWSEYEQLIIEQGAGGRPLFNVAVAIDPQCSFRAAGVQLARNVFQEIGTPLLVVPEEGAAADKIETLEAVIASTHNEQAIARKCRIPGIVAGVVVRPYRVAQVPSQAIEPVAFDSASTMPASDPAQVISAADADADGNQEPHATSEELGPSASPAAAHTMSENILRVDADKVDTVLNLVGELIIAKSMLNQTIGEFSRRFPKDPLRAKFADMMAHQAQVLNDLQRSVMKIRMVPVEQLFRRFPRVVRDVSKAQAKDVTLQMSGQETDLDKSILDALSEPMTHLVRNAVDHGIELPEARVAAGKPAQGTVQLNAYHQGSQVVIEVSDDGRGIEREKVATKALATGLVTRDELEHMSEAEVLELIFEPGFSTAEQVTEISGRGVGLDVVKAVLGRMKGSVSIHSRPGIGTTFQLKVPLTLAIIRALLFRVGERLYAVPLGAVLEIARAPEADIHRVDNHDVLQLRDEVLTMVRLNRLEASAAAANKKRNKLFIIVVTIAGRKFGLIVDRMVGEEELVIKALDDHLVSTELVNGASILGDGTVVLILNIAAVVEKLGRIRGASVKASDEVGPAESTVGANA